MAVSSNSFFRFCYLLVLYSIEKFQNYFFKFSNFQKLIFKFDQKFGIMVKINLNFSSEIFLIISNVVAWWSPWVNLLFGGRFDSKSTDQRACTIYECSINSCSCMCAVFSCALLCQCSFWLFLLVYFFAQFFSIFVFFCF